MNRRPPSRGMDLALVSRSKSSSSNAHSNTTASAFASAGLEGFLLQLDNLEISRLSPNNRSPEDEDHQQQRAESGAPLSRRLEPLLHVPEPLRCRPIAEEGEETDKKRSLRETPSSSILSTLPPSSSPSCAGGLSSMIMKDPMSLLNDACNEHQRKKQRKQLHDHHDALPLDLSRARIMPLPVPARAFPLRILDDEANDDDDDAVSQHSSRASSEAGDGPATASPLIEEDRFQYLFDFLRQTPSSTLPVVASSSSTNGSAAFPVSRSLGAVTRNDRI